MYLTLGMFSVSFSVILTVIGTFVLTTIFCIKYIFMSRDIVPSVYCKESSLANHLLKRCTLLKRPFKPSFWAPNGHMQTLLGSLLPGPTLEFDREYLQLKDKGILALDWVNTALFSVRRSSAIILVFPGVASTATSVSNFCDVASKKGYRVVVFNRRGHGNSAMTTTKMPGFGDPSDSRHVVEYIHQKHPRASIIVASMGSGASQLISYLGEYGSSSLVRAGVCISPPYDTTELLSRGIPKLYEIMLLIKLKQILLTHAKALSKVVNINNVVGAWTLREFDKRFYCKLSGMNCVDSFWDRNNPMRDVDDIAVPLMFLNSFDDPICAKENIAFDLFQYYPNMLLVAMERGGHCGFLEGWHAHRWSDKLAVDYIQAVLEFTSLPSSL